MLLFNYDPPGMQKKYAAFGIYYNKCILRRPSIMLELDDVSGCNFISNVNV